VAKGKVGEKRGGREGKNGKEGRKERNIE